MAAGVGGHHPVRAREDDAAIDALAAARAFVAEHYPEASCALLAGSVVRGEATPTSDLDIVVITARPKAPYRESCVAFGWPIEVFVHSHESYRRYFESDARRRAPSLAQMCAEGQVLRDEAGLAARIKDEARQLLARGPEPLTPGEIDRYRYAITDMLDDFAGSQRPDESLFIAPELAATAAGLILAHHRQWQGRGKWLLRALTRFDPGLAAQLTAALRRFYIAGEKEELVRFAENALHLVGGRLFAGYHARGRRPQT